MSVLLQKRDHNDGLREMTNRIDEEKVGWQLEVNGRLDSGQIDRLMDRWMVGQWTDGCGMDGQMDGHGMDK